MKTMMYDLAWTCGCTTQKTDVSGDVIPFLRCPRHEDGKLISVTPSEPIDDPEIDAFLRAAVDELYPKIKDSTFVMSIVEGDPSPQACMEIGAAVMFDKPIIAFALPGAKVPDTLRRLAFDVIEVNFVTGEGQETAAASIKRLLEDRQ